MCPPLLAAIPFAASMGSALGTSAAAGGLMIASLATSAAAAGMSYAGQKQASDDANKYQKFQYEETQRLATNNLMLQYEQIGLRQREEGQAFAQQMQVIQSEGMQALGQAAVKSGESGVYGNSVEALMNDFRRQQTDSVANLELNYAMRGRQIQAQALGFQGQAETTINKSIPQYQAAPSIVTPLLQTAGAGLNTAAMLQGPGGYSTPGGNSSNVVGAYSTRDGVVRNDYFGRFATPRFSNPYFRGNS